MIWTPAVHKAYLRAYKTRQKLELAEARYERGLDPRSGLNPIEYIHELKQQLSEFETEFETLKAANQPA